MELGYFFTAIWALLLLVSLFDRRASIGGRFAGLILGALAVVFGVVIAQTPAYVPLRAHGLEKEYWAEYLDWLEFLRASLHTRVAQEKPALAAGLGAPQTAASATPTADGSDAASNPTAATVKNAANGERSVLPRKPLSSISNKGWRERILTFLTYAPIVGFGVFFIIGVIGFLMSVFRRDFALTAVPLEWLLLIGGSLTTFPQFFFFRPDRPHLSEFMPGYIIAMMASAWLLWPRGSKHPVVRRLFAGLVSLFLIGQFLIFAVFAMQHPSSGTIAARFGRKARFQGENGVRVHTSKKEAAILQGVYDIVMKSSGPDDYLICYPYMPGYNVMTNRRTYLHNVYVDNATRGSHWSENTIRDLEEKHPAVVIIDDREINGTPASRFTHWGAPVYAFLKKHYKMAGKFETVEVFTLPHPSATPEAPAAPAPAPTPIPPATPAPAASTPTAPAPATPAPVVPPNPPPTESPATTPAPSTPPVPAPTTPSAPPTATPAPSTTPPGLPEAPPAGGVASLSGLPRPLSSVVEAGSLPRPSVPAGAPLLRLLPRLIRLRLSSELQGLQIVQGNRLAGKDGIALGAGFGERLRAQRLADAFLGDRRGVHNVVNEPRAVVIPEMVIGILQVGAERELRHDGVCGWSHHGRLDSHRL
ncbi:hypothetical protein CfE428DRAFT_5346 [Chthoniobacter flavus Ellin428]|uniref:Uncharacterized protein n=1 Tax=Chthoniobacter flavus Ellin428 TaxID=497964 RepID=B4D8V6_9BACT|nr:hypothetical protein CfE428DRAFT_5346 [Chthoniobacter flavus Ellin428]